MATTVEQHDAALEKELDVIAAMLLKVNTADVLARYAVATRIHAVLKHNRYGDHAHERLRVRLCWASGATIYDYARIVTAWPTRTAFMDVAGQLDTAGQRLSWSHLVKLTSVKSKRVRDKLIQQALDGCWSVSQLQRARAKHMGHKRGPGRPHRRSQLREPLHKLLKRGFRKNASDASRETTTKAVEFFIEKATPGQLLDLMTLLGELASDLLSDKVSA